MSKKVIRASDYWKNTRYGHLLDEAKALLVNPEISVKAKQIVRRVMTALIQSENFIPEEEIDNHEPLDGQNEMF